MERTYETYMARLAALLADAPPGAFLMIGHGLGGTLMDGAPVWFDLDDGISSAAAFDRSAWAGEAWDGETPFQTWGALECPLLFHPMRWPGDFDGAHHIANFRRRGDQP